MCMHTYVQMYMHIHENRHTNMEIARQTHTFSNLLYNGFQHIL